MTSTTFKYGIAFFCAENLWAAFSLLSTAQRFDETSISTWIWAYQNWGQQILRQLQIIKNAAGTQSFQAIQFYLWAPAMYPSMSRFVPGMMDVINRAQPPLTTSNTFCYKFVESFRVEPITTIAGFDSNQVHSIVFKSEFTSQQRKKYFKIWFEGVNKPIFVAMMRQLINRQQFKYPLTRTVETVLGSYTRTTNGQEIPTCGLFTYT
ncbi:hypothetical protein TKK_0002848, partial [Trichogramma kaykai]